MPYRAAWLIGSTAELPTQNLVIDGVPVVSSAGQYYLYDNDSSLSLCRVMSTAMVAAGLPGIPACVLYDSGKVSIGAGAVFTVAWGISTILRDLLGFTGDLAGAANYVAPLKSPLLWMPGKPETPMAHRLGTAGHKVHTMFQAVAPYSGRAESVSHGTRTYARYLFPMVDSEMVVTPGNEGGTWARWWQENAVKSARWKLYREVLEDPAGNSSVLGTLDQPLGPYVVSNQGKSPTWAYDMSKGFERTDKRADIDIRCHTVEEYA